MNKNTANPLTLFNTLQDQFRRQQTARNSFLETKIRIAGKVISLNFINEELQTNITRGLQHLSQNPLLKADAFFNIWDHESTQESLISAPWRESDVGRLGLIHSFCNQQFMTCYDTYSKATTLFDKDNNIGLLWFRSDKSIPEYEYSNPLRCLFHFWSRSQNMHLLHASAIGNNNGAVVISGRGGIGKSTTALNCVHFGLDYLGDDNCLIEAGSTSRVHCLYSSARIRHDGLSRVIDVDHSFESDHRNSKAKLLYFLRPQAIKQSTQQGVAIKAIIIPNITANSSTTIQPIKPVQAAMTLLPGTLYSLPGTDKTSSEFLKQLIQQAPIYKLNIGSDPKDVYRCISTLLDRV